MGFRNAFDEGLNQEEILILFVFGFTFLIGSFNYEMGIKYFTFVTVGSLGLMFIKVLIKICKERKR